MPMMIFLRELMDLCLSGSPYGVRRDVPTTLSKLARASWYAKMAAIRSRSAPAFTVSASTSSRKVARPQAIPLLGQAKLLVGPDLVLLLDEGGFIRRTEVREAAGDIRLQCQFRVPHLIPKVVFSAIRAASRSLCRLRPWKMGRLMERDAEGGWRTKSKGKALFWLTTLWRCGFGEEVPGAVRRGQRIRQPGVEVVGGFTLGDPAQGGALGLSHEVVRIRGLPGESAGSGREGEGREISAIGPSSPNSS